ncbi:MAG: 50S ribosomal protein L1, partial [Planctomycetota bacterium]
DEEGWDDYDVAVAHPATKKYVGRLGKVLGPKGKMPTPKAGTETPEVAMAVKEFAAGKIEYRTDDRGNVHVPVGKRSFQKDALIENITAFIALIVSLKPSDSKGIYIQKIVISSTMGPGVPVAAP